MFDFATTRNHALEQAGDASTFVMWLDADDANTPTTPGKHDQYRRFPPVLHQLWKLGFERGRRRLRRTYDNLENWDGPAFGNVTRSWTDRKHDG